jgi:quinol monooxygenase YgiN
MRRGFARVQRADGRDCSGAYNPREDAAMTDPKVYFLVDLAIAPGKLDAFNSVAKDMVAGSRNEPGTLGYTFYLSSDQGRCRLLETYADSAAVLAHLKGTVVQQLVPKLLQHSSMERFEVYGDPGAEASAMLAHLKAAIFQFHQGLSR